MAKRKIYNFAVILLLVVEVLILHFFPRSWTAETFLAGCVSFGIYFAAFLIFYALKWMGAGDVKLGGTLALLFGLQHFLVVWLWSVGLALGYAALVKLCLVGGREVWRRRLTAGDTGRKFVPYGALLCMAAMLFILKMEAGI